jgi:hypothetical protein
LETTGGFSFVSDDGVILPSSSVDFPANIGIDVLSPSLWGVGLVEVDPLLSSPFNVWPWDEMMVPRLGYASFLGWRPESASTSSCREQAFPMVLKASS